MWDRITAAFGNFFEGGKWGAYLGMAAGAIIGLLSPGAAGGNEIYAAVTGALMYGVPTAAAGAGLGVLKGLFVGSGDHSPAETPEPSQEQTPVAALEQAVEEPSHGLFSWLGAGGTEKGRGV